MPFPETLNAHPKIIFFTDWDGTITLLDTNDFITDNYGFGYERRRQGNMDMLHGTDTFRSSFQKMLDSWTVSIPEVISLMIKNIKVDPHFVRFAHWAHDNSVPIIVLSSGMVPIIRELLKALLGDLAEAIEVVANDIQPKPLVNDITKPHGWTIKFHDDSDFGHDKSLTIRPYADAISKLPKSQPRPILLYAGDGVSDVSAAKETDLLFAKRGRDLITYCEREGVPFTVFADWGEILERTKVIFHGQAAPEDVAVQSGESIAVEAGL